MSQALMDLARFRLSLQGAKTLTRKDCFSFYIYIYLMMISLLRIRYINNFKVFIFVLFYFFLLSGSTGGLITEKQQSGKNLLIEI
jgi:hypothetical protein